ncbi:hypothetical protein SK3146_03811 [Paenibacillus konkukensis]|uniref:Uncharacterized protein n=1 Tax=Paenibacillus konkukensis TaxID=2020716 RepID=A0ABY4RPY5_9BACL|nr:hypothetical protein [Paenibacillus konkukensis]UQZ84556.1 hypothetical protein SK3146_03811 [Paenibacillus konkukensis]
MKNQQLSAVVEVIETRSVQMKSKFLHSTSLSKAIIELEAVGGEYKYVGIVGDHKHDSTSSFWLNWFEKITGWKIRILDSLLTNDALLLIDKIQKILYFRRDLLRLSITQFMSLLKQIADTIINDTPAAIQRLQECVTMWSSNLPYVNSHYQTITVKKTTNGLLLPLSFKLSADDFYVSLITYNSEILLRTTNYCMSAAVNTIFSLTAIEVMIRFDGVYLEIQLPKEIREALIDMETILLTVKRLDY